MDSNSSFFRDGTVYDTLGNSDAVLAQMSAYLDEARSTVEGGEAWMPITALGCVGDGLTDNTTKLQAALNTHSCLFIPQGVFCTQALSIPTTLKAIVGPGTLKAVGYIAPYAAFLNATASTSLTVRDITLDVSPATFANCGALALVGSSNQLIENVQLINSGRFGVQIIGGAAITVDGCAFHNFSQSAITADTVSNLRFNDNSIYGPATVTGTNISIGNCSDVFVTNNYSMSSALGCWSISFQNVSGGAVLGNDIHDTSAEAIVVGAGSTDVEIANNVCRWSAGTGTDYGMSFGGTDPAKPTKRLNIHNNNVYKSHRTGIALDSYITDCLVSDNLIVDCNQENNPVNGNGIELAAFALSVDACMRNVVVNNVIKNVDSTFMRYGVREFTHANFNHVYNNFSYNMVTGTVLLDGAGSTKSVPGNANTVTITDDATTSATVYPVFVDASGNVLKTAAAGGKLAFNPFFGNLASYTYNGLNVIANGGNTLNIGNGKTFTASNTLTLTGTDGSSVAFGGGGTVAYANKVNTYSLTQTFTLAPVFTDASGTRTALGLGTAATQNTGTSGANVPLLNGGNTWSLSQTFTLAPTFTDAAGTRTALGLGTAATQSTGTSGSTLPFLSGTNTWGGVNTYTKNAHYQVVAGTGAGFWLDSVTSGADRFFFGGDAATADVFRVFSVLAGANILQYAANASPVSGVLTVSGTVAASGGVQAANGLLSTGGGVGYTTGAGGTVTQATSKTTGVALNKASGQITMNAAALAASTIVSFVLTNSTIAATDVLVINHVSGGTPGSYTFNAQCAAGSATINVRNETGGSLSEAIVLQYVLIKGVIS